MKIISLLIIEKLSRRDLVQQKLKIMAQKEVNSKFGLRISFFFTENFYIR